VPWLEAAFVVNAESVDAFHAEFEEDKVVAALPGYAHLVWIEETAGLFGGPSF
jgi:hypothetical protein